MENAKEPKLVKVVATYSYIQAANRHFFIKHESMREEDTKRRGRFRETWFLL